MFQLRRLSLFNAFCRFNWMRRPVISFHFILDFLKENFSFLSQKSWNSLKLKRGKNAPSCEVFVQRQHKKENCIIIWKVLTGLQYLSVHFFFARSRFDWVATVNNSFIKNLKIAFCEKGEKPEEIMMALVIFPFLSPFTPIAITIRVCLPPFAKPLRQKKLCEFFNCLNCVSVEKKMLREELTTTNVSRPHNHHHVCRLSL